MVPVSYMAYLSNVAYEILYNSIGRPYTKPAPKKLYIEFIHRLAAHKLTFSKPVPLNFFN